MNEQMNSGADSQSGSPDTGFGIYSANDQYSAAWTQFSGITQAPSPDEPPFGWDSFVTPPNTPANNQNDYSNHNYFLELNKMMNAMGKNTAANFDSSSHDTDKLASTPVAKSLLEALKSSSPMSHNPDLPLQNTLDFETFEQQGYEMYAEALQKYGSDYQQYTAFGDSPDGLNSSPSVTPPPSDWEKFGNASLKPSYSEVAKTLKNQDAGKEKDETDLSKKRSADSQTSRSFKGTKKFTPRQVRGRNNSLPDEMRPTVSPDSKYGLDDFSDVGKNKGGKDESGSGLDSIPVTRRNSASSLSSGTSGIEEIQLPKTCNNFSNVDSFEKISNKEKEKSLDENTKHASKEEKPFFDARRIFKTKDTNKRRSQSSQSKLCNEEVEPTILNNGKPSYSAWCSPQRKSTHYINNNLRDTQKKTNHNPGSSGKEANESSESAYSQGQGRAEKKSKSSSKPSSSKAKMPLQTSFDHELIDEWLSFLYDKGKLCLHQLWTLILMVILLIFSIIVYLVSGGVHISSWMWGKLWTLLETKVFKGKMFGGHKWGKPSSETPKKIGLEENIALPSTGQEAMQRLLACKGKDPYSILGLKATATDDDIKKYYRRQAVLVHPDKNQQPGAEEAFKILGHAFDLIGDAGKRQTYDRQLHEAKEAEAAMREFNDLLTKLQEKIQQASNMMRCDNCGGKHKRTPVERPWYSARYCDRCSIRHSAKEGDVWAETSMLGFLWHYYACMEGKVYDITEWVACKKEFFKHMQANAHHVFYRIATEGNRGHHNSRNNGGASNSEADLEDFISHLFHQAMNTDGSNSSNPQSWQPPQSNGQSWNNPSHTSTAPAAKRNRKKKRKH